MMLPDLSYSTWIFMLGSPQYLLGATITVGRKLTPAVPLFLKWTCKVPTVAHSSTIWTLDPLGELFQGIALIRDQ